MAKKLVGTALVSIPFALIASAMAYSIGIMPTLCICCASVALTVMIVHGITLLTE
jgi:hypothetical protein